ncbi:hypothetical protein [Pyrococcus abyssi]|uniref:Uncharacterized protein n=1 Tax=Pyrococcus abyssi (strain GE5 / Orsay) TaxID=272844 RepID=Q9V0Q1_PYRAB|nr:hypothetical protein [Pyrococcus abyssi]CAB49652.1 Hypothetical protein PAB0504 [Pyrococcus abyssi GE5]CCE70134.1 TPA: hypothetical protein PAB0504 [Pyrococcus abyssi GE5]
MKVTFRKSRFARITVEIPTNAVEVCEELGFSLEEVLKKLFLEGNFDFEIHSEEEVMQLEMKIRDTERKLYELEGSWSSLKFKLFQVYSDNRNLAIQISGLVSENKRLRKFLNLPSRDFRDVEELIRYYLNL